MSTEADELKQRLADLRKEMAEINYSNSVYWGSEVRTSEDQAAFQKRVARLQGIMDELARLGTSEGAA